MWVRWNRIGSLVRLRALASSSNDISVVAVIEEQMSPRLWDLVMTVAKNSRASIFRHGGEFVVVGVFLAWDAVTCAL